VNSRANPWPSEKDVPSMTGTGGRDNHPSTNTLAAASLVIGAITGHVARTQIQQRVEIVHHMVDVPSEVTPEQLESLRQALLRIAERKNGVAMAGIIGGSGLCPGSFSGRS
jgi:hypothetical protein